MRVVFYTLSHLSIETAKKFIDKDHDVIIIDPDKEKINDLSDSLDCGFLVGDASYPSILKETNPENVDFFFALSDNTQKNIVASLVARSSGIERTIVQIDDPDYEIVCEELGLHEVIIPWQIASQHLVDSSLNEHLMELFQFMKSKACLHKIVATEDQEGDVSALKLSDMVRVICYFRDGQFYHFDDSVKFKKGDEIVLITDLNHIDQLKPK